MTATKRQPSLRVLRWKRFSPGTVVRWPNLRRTTTDSPTWLYGCALPGQDPYPTSIKVYMIDPRALRIVPVPYDLHYSENRIERCTGVQGIGGLIQAVHEHQRRHSYWNDEASACNRTVFDDFTDQELRAFLASHRVRDISFFPVMQSFGANAGSSLDRERRERFFRVILPYALAKRSWGARAKFLARNLFSSQPTPFELCPADSPAQALVVERLYLPVLTRRDATWRSAQRALKDATFVEEHAWLKRVADPAEWSHGLWDAIGTRLYAIRNAGVLAAIVRDNWGLPYFPQLMRAFRGVKGAQRKRLTDLIRQQVRMQPALDAGLAEQTAKAAPAFARCFVG